MEYYKKPKAIFKWLPDVSSLRQIKRNIQTNQMQYSNKAKATFKQIKGNIHID